MKNSIALFAGAALLASSLTNAGQVLEVHSDKAVGGGFGGLGGFMLGAAAGGPLGALVGAGLGYLAGAGVQYAAGMEQRLYVIADENGNSTRVRTSDARFVPGQQVLVDGSRISAVAR